MPISRFPDPRKCSPEGLVALGGDLQPATLLEAYRNGIFPWPISGYPMAWFCPGRRGILRFSDLHIPRRLAEIRRKSPLRFTLNQAFTEVIRTCAAIPRKDPTTTLEEELEALGVTDPGEISPEEISDEPLFSDFGAEGETEPSSSEANENPEDSSAKTWITPEIIDAYTLLHRMGHAHSVEAWRDGQLVGGLYGVEVDGVFAGESMFHQESNASKLVLLHLIELLQAQGATWMDIQMVTPHMKALGATGLPRNQFLDLLAETQAKKLDLSGCFLKPPRPKVPSGR